MRSILDKPLYLHKDLRALDTQQHDSHDTRVIQLDEYCRHHITPDAGKHVPHPTYTTVHHLIDTSHVTAALAPSLNTPHHTDAVFAIYDRWTLTLLPHSIFLKSDLPTDTCRKYALFGQ